jgi:hypothetical protein
VLRFTIGLGPGKVRSGIRRWQSERSGSGNGIADQQIKIRLIKRALIETDCAEKLDAFYRNDGRVHPSAVVAHAPAWEGEANPISSD